MELFCEKYKEKMTAAAARCRHPREYCKFRTACLINFMAKEAAEPPAVAADQTGSAAPAANEN